MEQTSNKVFRERLITFLFAIAALYTFVLSLKQDLWVLVLLAVPIIVTYVAFNNINETLRVLKDIANTIDLRDI